MKEVNSHYVPRLSLRQFGDKLNMYNVQTGEYKENVSLENAFAEKGFYTEEVEDKLNKRVESQFANLFNNKLLKENKTLELSRQEVKLIKKFLLISIIRSYDTQHILQIERELRQKQVEELKNMPNVSSEEIDLFLKNLLPEEKVIEHESSYDYWMRTINVILDTDGSPEEIIKHPYMTFPAFRWASVINYGYLAFWDSNYKRDEYVITDIGMTSENEKGWNGITVQNHIKKDYLSNFLENEKNPLIQQDIGSILLRNKDFHENFMMFPISGKRMIVEINPFFKFRINYKDKYKMPELKDLTELVNEDLYYPNDCRYVLNQYPNFQPHEGDRYIYQIKQLTSKETRYCNALFLDRIDTWMAFANINKVAGSLYLYYHLNKYPYVPRVNYKNLYNVISTRFASNIDIKNIWG